ncbi:MAG: helix-turn-helix transcriptional regulator [Eggerthellaceae bacterium]|nr:helix-turn-helix transcriptional regulator [Eggerthellaceae bacterium]MBQ9068834.1 helix-turn-helix transcriptional regulator [Eggerthellaceae bacterium]
MISASTRKMIEKYGLSEKKVEEKIARLYDWIEEYNLQEIRKELDLTQEQVAERIGVGQGRISDIERGNIASLSVGTLARYADALDCDVRVLFSPRNSDLPPARIAVG